MSLAPGERFKFRKSRSGLPGLVDVFLTIPGSGEEMSLGVIRRAPFTRGWLIASLTVADPAARSQPVRLPIGKPYGSQNAAATWLLGKVRKATTR